MIDGGALVVAAAFIVAATVLLVAIYRRFGTPSPARDDARQRRTIASVTHPFTNLVFGSIGFAIAGAFLGVNLVAANTYAHDASCSDIRLVSPPGPGACRSQSVRIVGTHIRYARKGGPYYEIQIAFLDGHPARVVLAGPYSDRFWNDARDGVDTDAVAQSFQGEIVAIATASGIARTDRAPAVHTRVLWIVTFIFAVLAIVSFVRVRRRSFGRSASFLR